MKVQENKSFTSFIWIENDFFPPQESWFPGMNSKINLNIWELFHHKQCNQKLHYKTIKSLLISRYTSLRRFWPLCVEEKGTVRMEHESSFGRSAVINTPPGGLLIYSEMVLFIYLFIFNTIPLILIQTHYLLSRT